MLSVSFVLPVMGRIFDRGIAARLPADQTVATLTAAVPGTPGASLWINIQAAAGLETLGRVAVLPALVTLVFAFLLLGRQKRAAGRGP
jgi:hypothetical protein